MFVKTKYAGAIFDFNLKVNLAVLLYIQDINPFFDLSDIKHKCVTILIF